MRTQLLLPILILAACVTAEKRYEQAAEDEAEGRWVSATRKYIDVLHRDPEYPGAREKATSAGNKAVAGYLDVINELDCDDPTTLSHIETLELRGVTVDHDC